MLCSGATNGCAIAETRGISKNRAETTLHDQTLVGLYAAGVPGEHP